jgi:fused signal recognition particle receptor
MQSDPYEYLLNAGSHLNTWLLLGGPIGLFVLVGIILFIFVRVRRAREERELEVEYKSAGRLDSEPVPQPAKGHEPQAPAVATTPVEASLQAHVEPPADDDISEIKAQDQQSWIGRLRTGLARTRDAFAGSLSGIFTAGAKIDDPLLERIHEVLYRADVGVKTSDRLVDGLRTKLAGQTVDWLKVRDSLSELGEAIFSESICPLNEPSEGLFVLLVVGVNGVGKTTTIGKLAARFTAEGKKVMLCAGDTYRAAAIEQLVIWGERNQVPVIKQHHGADPAAVAFDGVKAGEARGMDVLIIDTAGRLHNKSELMAELSKINKSIGKGFTGAPHETWIVVDATTGQNAVQQVKAFSEVTKVTGIVVTKLDGTAKGGVIIGLADQFKIPIRYIGVGEKAADLRAFSGADFMRGLLDR